jgi:hypothetical protein
LLLSVIEVHYQYLKAYLKAIALLSVFSKIFEKLFYNRITNYLCHHNLLHPSQHGFIKGKSTMSAAFQLINEIIWGLSNQKEIIGIFFDLSKAFDTLNHDILFSKLNHMGINGNALAWIRSYLSDRKQIVQINTNHKFGTNIHRSNVLVSNCGVPLGSILGPLLFIIFINDLQSHMPNSKVTLYADDTSTLNFGDQSSEANESAQLSVTNMCNWCKSNNLQLNENKTCFLKFNNKKCHPNTSPLFRTSSKRSIQQLSSTKFLGLILNDNLHWQFHIDAMINKIGTGIFMIRKLAPTTSIQVLKLVYYAKIHSHLSYGVIFWGYSSAATKAFSMQKRSLKAIAGVSIRTPGRPLFFEYKIMTLPCIYIYYCALLVKMNAGLFSPNSSVHGYSTHGSENIHLLMQSCAASKKGPHHSASIIFNKLPTSLKNISSIHMFKANLRKLLLCKCYYSVDEFLSDVW